MSKFAKTSKFLRILLTHLLTFNGKKLISSLEVLAEKQKSLVFVRLLRLFLSRQGYVYGNESKYRGGLPYERDERDGDVRGLA